MHVYDAKPSVRRQLLLAGEGGLNITHNESLTNFLQRYDQVEWLSPMILHFGTQHIREWMHRLGIDSFVDTSGHIFPVHMKTSPLLRSWLSRIQAQIVQLHTQCRWTGWHGKQWQFTTPLGEKFVHAEAVILALGGASWPGLGSDGAWVQLLQSRNFHITPVLPSNGGFHVNWSDFMIQYVGSPLKTIRGWVNSIHEDEQSSMAECVVTHYEEGRIIYALSRTLRELEHHGTATLHIDLMPHKTLSELTNSLTILPKQFLVATWKRIKLTGIKANHIRDGLPKTAWSDGIQLAQRLKNYPITLTQMRPIAEAMRTAGGISRRAMDDNLLPNELPDTFGCVEMLDGDAPAGGYLLTACCATVFWAAQGVLRYLSIIPPSLYAVFI